MLTLETQAKVVVYYASPNDIPGLLPLLREFGQFSSDKYSLYPGDETAAQILNALIHSQPVFVAKAGTKIIGCIAGMVSPHIFNPNIRVLHELFWWVTPEHRGSRAGIMLLDGMVMWAKQHVQIFVMTLEEKSPVNPRTLEKRGFKLREHNYTLEV